MAIKISEKTVPIDSVKTNPDNPRSITSVKFEKLVKSITDFPEMLEIRQVIVDENMMILGGNMRHKACISAGVTEIPVKIVSGLSKEKKKEFIIKDNVSGGEWDFEALTENWDIGDLSDWGIDLPSDDFSSDYDDDSQDIESQDADSVVNIDKLKFGKHSVGMTANEFKMLEDRLFKHIDEFGVNSGFVNCILGGKND
jgi:hypothetical protein